MISLYRLIRESGLSKTSFVLTAMLACLSSLLAALPPHFLGAAVNAIVGAETASQAAVFSPISILNGWLSQMAGSLDLEPLPLFLGLFLIFTLVYLGLRNIFAVFVAIVSDRFILFVRRKCFARIIRAEKADLARFDSGDLVHRVMSDTQQLDYLIGHPLYTLCSDLLDLIWISAILLLMDWKILPILASVIPILYLISQKTGRVQRAYAAEIQRNDACCTGFIQRSILGIDTVKAYQGEPREIEDFARLTGANFAARKKSNISLGLFFPQEAALRAVGTMAAIAYVAGLATKDLAYIGTIPILLVYTTKFYAPLGNWARYYQTIQRGLVSYQRILEVLGLREEVTSPSSPEGLERVLPLKIDGSIALESGQVVALSLEVAGPTLVLLKGKSGVGKTLLIKSLVGLGCRFQGDLKFGRKSLTAHQEARNQVALATQDGHFIPGTLAENLSYPSTGVDQGKCRKILEALHLDYGPDHPVAEYGRNLSIGEQRRIIFGRALYSDKPVLILDEIDANVDDETRSRIYQVIRREMGSKVIIMVSHLQPPELIASGGLAVTIKRDAV